MCLLLMLFSNKPLIRCKDNVLIKAIIKLNNVLEKQFFFLMSWMFWMLFIRNTGLNPHVR
jgi:hypothetical protein